MSAERTGHCFCGAVRISLSALAHELGACHCEMCRRWTGSAFLTLAVPEAALRIEGADHVRHYASSPWAERCFCDTCGSTLWYRLTGAGMPRDHYIAAGLLDDLSGMRLAHEIFIDRKPEAFAFAGPTHQMTEAEFLAQLPASPEE